MRTMRFTPKGYGGDRRAPDQVKRDGWKEQGVLAVAVDDDRLTWPERELVRQLGEKLYGKRGRPAMGEWTRDMVEERVLEAAGVLKKLPGPRAQGYFSTWPDMLLSAREIARQEPKPMKVLPSPQAISRMEETLTWNRFLEPDEAHLMWARAEGTPWKGICYRFGISRPTAHRRWEYALSVIAWRLNGRDVHHRRGRRFVVARAG